MEQHEKIDSLCHMQSTLISCLKSEIDMGIMNADTKEVGEVADIIKDLAMAEKYNREAKYYELVADAMENEGPTGYSMGYTRPYKPMVDQENYIRGYMHDPNFKDNMRGTTNDYGIAYSDYLNAKRHYTETHSNDDRVRMEKDAREHLDQTIDTMEDIWGTASPELKLKMKTDLKKLVETMV